MKNASLDYVTFERQPQAPPLGRSPSLEFSPGFADGQPDAHSPKPPILKDRFRFGQGFVSCARRSRMVA